MTKTITYYPLIKKNTNTKHKHKILNMATYTYNQARAALKDRGLSKADMGTYWQDCKAFQAGQGGMSAEDLLETFGTEGRSLDAILKELGPRPDKSPKRSPPKSKAKTPTRGKAAVKGKTAKKTTTKKTSTKKTPAKKTPAKKTPAKKTPAKKTPVKKTPVKKTPAKKTPKQWAALYKKDYGRVLEAAPSFEQIYHTEKERNVELLDFVRKYTTYGDYSFEAQGRIYAGVEADLKKLKGYFPTKKALKDKSYDSEHLRRFSVELIVDSNKLWGGLSLADEYDLDVIPDLTDAMLDDAVYLDVIPVYNAVFGTKHDEDEIFADVEENEEGSEDKDDEENEEGSEDKDDEGEEEKYHSLKEEDDDEGDEDEDEDENEDENEDEDEDEKEEEDENEDEGDEDENEDEKEEEDEDENEEEDEDED